MKVIGQLVDIHSREIYPAEIYIENGKIAAIERVAKAPKQFIMPGLIDAHVHIESSMLTPGSFALASVPHGTIGVVSDPHEIGNVLGSEGVMAMIEDGKMVPLKFYFGAPSCVPATGFETSGAVIDSKEIERLLGSKDIYYLAEMMNFPGVIYNDEEVSRKLKIAGKLNKRIDGHAPGLKGEQLEKYVKAGISTDHECSTIDEALEKIALGMKILIREGSAARNLAALKELFRTNPGDIMLCSDDLHPEMLLKRHLDKIIAGLISEGYNQFDVIRSATINPAMHYGLNTGLLRAGDAADFIIVDQPDMMNISETWIDGVKVFDRGKMHFKYKAGTPVNKFNCTGIKASDISVISTGSKLRVINALDGELLTKEHLASVLKGALVNADPEKDILKIIVKDRYNDAPPAVGFIKGFGLKHGAFASSVAHDSHNIISVGTSDEEIVCAVNEVIRLKGGLSVCLGKKVSSMQLEFAGLMSGKPCRVIAEKYQRLSDLVKKQGSLLSAPFMTLSFMALLVIPELKLSDRGLFDGKKFCFVPLFED